MPSSTVYGKSIYTIQEVDEMNDKEPRIDPLATSIIRVNNKLRNNHIYTYRYSKKDSIKIVRRQAFIYSYMYLQDDSNHTPV